MWYQFGSLNIYTWRTFVVVAAVPLLLLLSLFALYAEGKPKGEKVLQRERGREKLHREQRVK